VNDSKGPPGNAGGTKPAAADPDPAAVLAELTEKLDDPAATRGTAHRAISDIDGFLSRLRGAQLGDAYFVQMQAYGVLADDARACDAARKAKDLVPPGGKARRLDMILASDNCK
jgi:hypothetical protein